MQDIHGRARDYARIALGCIRLFNGLAGLLAPHILLRGLQLDPQQNPGASYAFRLFGVRTVILGAELLRGDSQTRQRSLRLGILIHASDTLAAVMAGISGLIPRPAATRVALLSALNTCLALYASSGDQVQTDQLDQVPDTERKDL